MLNFLTGNWFFFFMGIFVGVFLGNRGFRQKIFDVINGFTKKKEEPPSQPPPKYRQIDAPRRARRSITVNGKTYYSYDEEEPPQ